MTRKILSLVLVLLLCVSLTVVAFAASGDEWLLTDGADLLTDTEETSLLAKLDQISRQYGAQVSVVTLSSIDGGDIDEFVERLYDGGGYGYGNDKAGVLLLVCMDVREYRILSNGFAAQAITAGDIDAISDAIVSSLSAGDYADAFSIYAEECQYHLDGHINGFPFHFGKKLLIAVVIGLVVGLIVALILKGQLKSVRKQSQANAYVKPGSMQLTQSGDFFMYRNVTRTAKQQSSSSSRSGSSRNVGGGSF